jgi:KDO2-lipid IV(A) lauroyltransferase
MRVRDLRAKNRGARWVMSRYPDVPPYRWMFTFKDSPHPDLKHRVLKALVATNLRIATATLRVLPFNVASSVGAAFGTFSGRYRYRKANSVARANRLRLRPDLANAEAAIAQHWSNIGRTMAQLSQLDRLFSGNRIVIHDRGHLDTARLQGRPLIFASVHLGNWEVIPPTLMELGIDFVGAYDIPESSTDHDYVRKARSRYGVKTLNDDTSGARDALRALQGGRSILLYVDELHQRVVNMPRFGRPEPDGGNVTLVSRLAALTGAVVVPTYNLRDASGKFHVFFMEPIFPLDSGSRADRVSSMIQALDATFSPVVLANIDQWLWLFALDFDRPM